jgi:3-deoxy-D-manno-octulosonic-acid transferase
VLADLRPTGLRVALRTEAGTGPVDALVVNTTGELRDWYHVATVVFIGKSLTAHGGQNPVEPVLAGQPVVFGPHMENFQAIVARWLAADAAVQVRDPAELRAQIQDLLARPERRKQLVARAQETVAAHAGATARTVEVILARQP